MSEAQGTPRISHADGLLMVSLFGEITFQERASYRDMLIDLSANTPATRIEINLQEVSRLDSSGLALLVDMYKRFDGQISVLVAESSQPYRLLKRANIVPFLNVRPIAPQQ